ncbi:uncharacterized protein [Mytilus edulis]|uniref:uncharacterized protein n=1 Tax=Mytilus edulis TaxID=6550 RepID=UPI0039EF76A0
MEIAPFEINESHIQALIAPTPIDLGDVGKIASLAQDELVAISGSLVKTAPKTTTDKTTLQIATMTDEKRVTGQNFKVKFWAGNQEDVVTAMERFTTYSPSSMVVKLWQGAVQFNATLDTSIKKLQEDLKIDAANIEGVDFAEKLVLTSVGEYPVDDDVLNILYPEQAFQERRTILEEN